MTIIAYRDGIMASDSGCYAGGIMVRLSTRILRLKGGGLAAGTGSLSSCHRFEQWMRDDEDRPFNAHDADFYAILVNPQGEKFSIDEFGLAIPLDAPFATTGCAWKMAYGAMAAGASAEKAVQIAIEFHDGCHGPVQLAKLGDHG